MRSACTVIRCTMCAANDSVDLDITQASTTSWRRNVFIRYASARTLSSWVCWKDWAGSHNYSFYQLGLCLLARMDGDIWSKSQCSGGPLPYCLLPQSSRCNNMTSKRYLISVSPEMAGLAVQVGCLGLTAARSEPRQMKHVWQ